VSAARRYAASLLALSLLVVGLGGCGGDDDSAKASPTTPTTSTTSNVATCTESRSKPTVDVPATAPSKLVTKDLEVGHGPTVAEGATVSVQYVGVSFSTKQQFDASWDRNQPFNFVVGDPNIIQGWNQGLVGMKLCGRRQLVIPPDLGYGAQGSGDIKPNETLVFVIDVLAIA
jgi:peptidylprolyl isomerase